MKKMKRLNNKGFTLIELLAVVVILAVVMGIAMNSVLSSMNKSRGGSLADTAQVIASGFNTKYTESLVDSVPTDVYGDVLGSSASDKKGYDFSKTAIYEIDSNLADTFNISGKNYVLGNGATEITVSGNTGATVGKSFVSYNSTTGKFVVCMVAAQDGSNYVAAYATDATVKLSELGTDSKPAGIASTDSSFNGITIGAKVMMACSDGTRTWK